MKSWIISLMCMPPSPEKEAPGGRERGAGVVGEDEGGGAQLVMTAVGTGVGADGGDAEEGIKRRIRNGIENRKSVAGGGIGLRVGVGTK